MTSSLALYKLVKNSGIVKYNFTLITGLLLEKLLLLTLSLNLTAKLLTKTLKLYSRNV